MLCCTVQAHAQNIDSLRTAIEKILSSRNAVVGVSISGNDGKDTLSIHGERHFPMQSVFKFHIGLVMLSEIDQGNFSLAQPVQISKKELSTGLYSPIREKYPDGVTLSLSEVLEYTISLSDNIGCDIVLQMLGGTAFVENYFKKQGFNNIAIQVNEETMQKNWEFQFRNWTTPKEAVRVLETFYKNENRLLSDSSHDFIWKAMRETSTGKNRLKSQLPESTVVAHKTGSSGTNPKTGITAGVNDIGVIFLPNGKHFFISVFVTGSKENEAVNEKIVADIAKAAWDYFVEFR